MDILTLINKYYTQDNDLKKCLLAHSEQVRDKALEIASKHPELNLDIELLSDGAMTHDIGIFLTNAPSIHCFGKENYLLHGFLGAEIMRKEGYEKLARICERHTGTGLSAKAIEENNLPVKVQDYFPESLEEIIICYADKFFSKSKLGIEKTPAQAYQSLLKFGEPVAKKFIEWNEIFG